MRGCPSQRRDRGTAVPSAARGFGFVSGVSTSESAMASPARQSWTSVREAVLARDESTSRECRERFPATELDVRHLIPRKEGGSDDPTNLITLCDGCHGARHATLQVSLARRMLESWALGLARLVDRQKLIPETAVELRHVLAALGVSRLREAQLEPILAALRGESVIVIRPTGAGKSLCFKVPALARRGTALVISPLQGADERAGHRATSEEDPRNVRQQLARPR
jgi:ATP-dependent DNA helicase RecQ